MEEYFCCRNGGKEVDDEDVEVVIENALMDE